MASSRERLPNRRSSTAFEFALRGLHFVGSYSCFGDGCVAEIFLQNHKPASQADCNARDAAVAASLALQHGCPLQTLQRAVLREDDGTASTPLGAALDAISRHEGDS
jgi:hypothetical protein